MPNNDGVKIPIDLTVRDFDTGKIDFSKTRIELNKEVAKLEDTLQKAMDNSNVSMPTDDLFKQYQDMNTALVKLTDRMKAFYTASKVAAGEIDPIQDKINETNVELEKALSTYRKIADEKYKKNNPELYGALKAEKTGTADDTQRKMIEDWKSRLVDSAKYVNKLKSEIEKLNNQHILPGSQEAINKANGAMKALVLTLQAGEQALLNYDDAQQRLADETAGTGSFAMDINFDDMNLHPEAIDTTAKFADILKLASDYGNRLKSTFSKLKSIIPKTFKYGGKSADDFSRKMRRLSKFVLQFVLGFRSAYFAIKKLRTIFIESFKAMAEQVPEINEQVSALMTAINQFKGNVVTAFQPIVSTVIPIMLRFIDVLNNAGTALGTFFAQMTGQEYIYKFTAAQVDYAKSVEDSKDKTDKLKKSLASFDTLNILQDNSKDTDTYDPTEAAGGKWEKVPIESSLGNLADRIKQAWSDKDFTEVGYYLGEKLKGSLEKATEYINGPLRTFALGLATSLATFINGFVSVPGLAEALGTAVGSAINLAMETLNTFLETTNWVDVGQFIADFLNQGIKTIKAEDVGRLVANVLLAGIDMWHTFVSEDGFDFEQLGTKISTALNAFFDRMAEKDETGKNGWYKLGESLTNSISGLITTLTVAIEGLNSEEIGQAMSDLIAGTDWSKVTWDLAGLAASILHALADAIIGLANENPLAASIATVIGLALGSVKVLEVIGNAKALFSPLTGAISGSVSAIGLFLESLVSLDTPILTLREAFVKVFGAAKVTFFGIVGLVVGLALAVVNFISMLKDGFSWAKEKYMLIGIAIAAISATILGVPGLVAAAVAAVVATVTTCIVMIKEDWEGFKEFIGKLWEEIVAFATAPIDNLYNLFDGLITGILLLFEDFPAGVEVIISSLINFIIDGINTLIKGINLIITPIRRVIEAIGMATGKDWSFEKIKIPEIPRFSIPALAQGAVIPPNKQFLAMLGDQKQGTNIEAPLSTIEDAVRNVLAEQKYDFNVTANGSMGQLIRLLKLEIQRDDSRASAF